MKIQIISPFNQGARFGLDKVPEGTVRIKFTICEEGAPVKSIETCNFESWTVAEGLSNGVNFEVYAEAFSENGEILETSGKRNFCANFIPGTCVNYVSVNEEHIFPQFMYIGSPSIVRLKDGTLITSNDFFDLSPKMKERAIETDIISTLPSRETNITKVYKSTDNGVSWSYLTTIGNCMWGQLFEFKGRLYIMAIGSRKPDEPILGTFKAEYEFTDGRIYDIILYESADGGKNWNRKCNITEKFNVVRHFHKAATPVTEHNGRLFVAFEGPKNPETGFTVTFASVSTDDDIMIADNWTVATPFLEYNPKWEGTINRHWPYMMEEANAVVAPDGKINVIARYNSVFYPDEFIDYSQDGFGLKAVVMVADENDYGAPLNFSKMQPFIGGLSKFSIRFDSRSKKYYSLVSRITGNRCCQRNILTLVSSADLEKWEVERDCLNLEDMNWYQSCRESGMYYADFIFDGDDILAVCRTALHDCFNFHNSNMMTFHRFRNFRDRNYK